MFERNESISCFSELETTICILKINLMNEKGNNLTHVKFVSKIFKGPCRCLNLFPIQNSVSFGRIPVFIWLVRDFGILHSNNQPKKAADALLHDC